MASQDVIERALVSGSPDAEAPALAVVLAELVEAQRDQSPSRLHPADRQEIIDGTIAGVIEYLRTQPDALAAPGPSHELITAKQATERWPALSQQWFYDNKTELGAIIKGNGSVKPRMVFDPQRIEAVLAERQADAGPRRPKAAATGTPRQSPRSRAKAARGDADTTPSGNPRLTRPRRKVRARS